MAGEGDLEGGEEVGRGEGLDDVGHGAGGAGALDELGLGEGGEHDDGAAVLLDDLLGGGDAVHDGHLDVHDAEVGLMLACEADGFLAVSGLGDDLVAGLGEGLDDVESDEGLVLGDENPTGASAGLGTHGGESSMIAVRSGPNAARHEHCVASPCGGRAPPAPP